MIDLISCLGDFDNFENVVYERYQNQQKAFEAQQRKISHVQAFIDRFRYNANRANLVQSRLKVLFHPFIPLFTLL